MSLRYKRLEREVQERVIINGGDVDKSLEEVLDKLRDEWDVLYDNDRHVQAFDKMRDVNVLLGMIAAHEAEAPTSINYPSISEILKK